MLVELLLLLICILIVFYRFATKNHDYFAKRRMPHLPPKFLFGNTGPYVLRKERPNEFLDKLYHSMPAHKIFGILNFRTPTLVVTDPQLIKHITVKDFDHFVDHRTPMEATDDNIVTLALPLMSGEKWRQMRTTLSPAFTGHKMRQMFELVSDCAADMCGTLAGREATQLQSLEMKDLFSKYANDVIATTAFGVAVNSFANEQNEFLANGRRALDTNNLATAGRFLLVSLWPWLARKLDVQVIDSQAMRFFKTMVLETMETRQRAKIYRPDVIDLLMQLREGKTLADDDGVKAATKDGLATAQDGELLRKSAVKHTWTDNEIVAQCFLFFAGGFDTVSTALATLSYELATNMEVQDRLYAECAEVRERLAGTKLTYDVLQAMQYMDQVVTESMRLWPPFITERTCVKDYVYDDGELRFEVDAGQLVWIPIDALHHDERWFADAKRFDPDRFGAERIGDIVPGTYMPFGAGPRGCIASRFALMELKASIYHLMLQFRFEPCAETQIPLKVAKNPGGFQSERGIYLTLAKREG